MREIRGDIVLDSSAFALPEGAADFDGEPLRPYNVQPDALLLNHKAVTYSFVPDAAARRGPGAGRAGAGRRAVDAQRAAVRRPLRRLARRA